MNENILVIDDESDILRTVESILTKEGYRVRSASGGAEAIEIFKSEPFDLVITDIRMPEMNGLEVMWRVKEMDEDVEVIILTGFASTENAIQSLRDDMAFDYLTKPLEKIEDLLLAVKRALEKRGLRMQNKDLLNELKIGKNKLEERINERTRKLRTANIELSAVNAIAATMNQSLDKQGILKKVVEKITDVLRIPRCAVILFDESKQSGTIEAGYDEFNFPGHGVGERVAISRNPGIQEVVETRKAVLIEDALLDPRTSHIRRIVNRFDIKSIIFIPLIHRDEIIGVMVLDKCGKDPSFRDSEIRLITTVAENLTVALINSALFEQTERQLKALGRFKNVLEKRVEERTAQLTLTNEKLQEEILEHKQAEEALTESRQVLRSVFDGISEPLILLGPDLTVKGINRAAKNYFHRETFHEVLGKPCYEGLLERSSPCEGCRIASNGDMTNRISFERKCIFDGSRDEQVDVYCLDDKGLKGAIIRIHDITEKRQIRNQLIRADRLTSLGQLSSGIAHEIRNPLASMRLFLDILCDESKFRQTDQEKEILTEIGENIGRVDDIIKRVLDFARPPVTASNTFGVNRLIRKCVKLWSEKFRKSRVKQNLHLENDLPSVRGDKVGIEQVVCNLLLNAIEAMDKGGVLGITTTKGISSLNHGEEVVITEIKDDGPGIKPGDTENIFNPFFTTKPTGTGLGLAISHQIIEHHGGTIHAKSEPGEGTVFTVELPVGALEIVDW